MALTKAGASVVLRALSEALAGGAISLHEGRPGTVASLLVGEVPLANPALEVGDGLASVRARSGSERALRDGRPDWLALRDADGEALYVMPFGTEAQLDRPMVEIGSRLFIAEGVIELPVE